MLLCEEVLCSARRGQHGPAEGDALGPILGGEQPPQLQRHCQPLRGDVLWGQGTALLVGGLRFARVRGGLGQGERSAFHPRSEGWEGQKAPALGQGDLAHAQVEQQAPYQTKHYRYVHHSTVQGSALCCTTVHDTTVHNFELGGPFWCSGLHPYLFHEGHEKGRSRLLKKGFG